MATFDGTTIERVRATLFKESGDTSFDTVLGMHITTASRQIERWLNSPFSAESRTETFNIKDGAHDTLFLGASPVSAVTSVKYDSTGQFSGDETTVTATSYVLEPLQGLIRLRYSPSIGFGVYQVVYTGGLAVDTDALVAAYPEIATAVELQTAYLFQIGDAPHLEQESFGGAAIKSSEPGGVCRRAREVCGHLTRHRF